MKTLYYILFHLYFVTSVFAQSDFKLFRDNQFLDESIKRLDFSLQGSLFKMAGLKNVSDLNIEYVDSILRAWINSVAVSGNYGYCTLPNGLIIFDVSNPANPIKVSELYLGGDGGTAGGIYLSGNYVYITNGWSGLKIVDVSNPSSPILKGSYDTPGWATSVTLSGTLAYVADAHSGLQIIDVSNSLSPTSTGSFITSNNNIFDVAVSGGLAYLTDYNFGLRIIDVSNPSSPVQIGSFDTPGSATRLVVIGGLAYVADYDSGLQIIDVSNPSSPTRTGSCDTPGDTWSVVVNNGLAYMGDSGYGLQIIDVSNPSSPTLKGNYDTPGGAGHIAMSGRFIHVADASSGLQIIDVSNPLSPTLKGSYNTPYNPIGVYVRGSYAYVADGFAGLKVINISTPSSPSLVGSYDTPGQAIGVFVSGSYAYVGDWRSGLQVINISTPSSPALVGSYDTPGEAVGVFVSGSYAYVGDWRSGLQVINVSNPSSPSLVGSYDTPEDAYGIYVSGSYAYVGDGSSGLQVINISNPSSPSLVGSYNTLGNAQGVYVSGSYAYVGDGSSGLQVINISNPSFPSLVGSYDTPGEANGVYVSGSNAYVADGSSGLQVINISTPSSPSLVGNYDTPGFTYNVFVGGSNAYVADSYSLMILRFSGESDNNTPSIASFTVTPSSGTTSTTFTLDASGSTDAQDATSVLQVRWDWQDDGIWDTQYSTTKTATHQYNTVGIYTIKLEVKDTGGLTTTTTKPCTVRTGILGGHFRTAYSTTGSNATVLIQTSTKVSVNNNPFTLSTNDEIAIYTPLPDTMCCGVGIWDGSNIAITVWGDNDQTATIKEGFTAGQAYTFHLWDASELKEYRFGTATFSTGGSTYSTNGISIVDTVSFSSVIRLPISLSSGWNIISSNVTPSNLLMTEIFKDIVLNVVIVKNVSGKVYWPRYNINQIGNWNVVDGYQIYMSNAATLTIEGQRVNPSTPISLPAGWSMISYLPNVSMSPARACSSLSGKIVIMKDVSGKVYWPRYSIDQIGTMQVGKGYQIYLSSAGTLTYPASVSKEGFNLVDCKNYGQISPQHFAYIRGTGANATILMRMNEKPVINGTALEVGDEIGVFTPEGICACAGVWNGDDMVITVWGDNGETMNIDGFTDGQAYTFRLWDKNTTTEKEISVNAESGNLTYSENGITVISNEKSTSLPENFILRQNYPNPFNPTTRIDYQIKTQSEVTLAIYNTAGQLVRVLVRSSQPAGVYSVEWDGRNSSGIQVPSSIYLYRLQAGSFVETRKMVMMK